MAVAVVMSRGRAKYLQTSPQTSPKPKASGSVAETIGVFYGVGTVVGLYDFIPCWEWTGSEFVSRSCTFVEGESFQLAANVIQHTGDVEGTIYVDFCYYDEVAATWVSIIEEDTGSAPLSIGPCPPGKYCGLMLQEDLDVYQIQSLGMSPPISAHYGRVIIVPGKYRTYDLGKTHYFGFKAWGEDESEPTLPSPV